jgi:uncharacterized membrane protein
MHHRHIREHLPLAPKQEEYFRWRGSELLRIEGFTDAVFAFAVALLIVALEVPHTYEGLINVAKSFPAFVVCFALLMTFWSGHYRYFRRYGLEDGFTLMATMGVLVLVLFSVYPLKFLFTVMFAHWFHFGGEQAVQVLGREETQMLYALYGGGLGGIWLIYALMYRHALKLRNMLGLQQAEIIMTRASFYEYLIFVAVCLTSVMLAFTTSNDSLPGYVYIAMAPLQIINMKWHTRKLKRG